MRRALIPALVVLVGLVLIVDYAIANPTVDAIGAVALDYLIVLAAAAGIAGGIEVATHQAGQLTAAGGDRVAAGVALAGMAVVLVIGFFPGSAGTSDPAMRWLVSAVLIPLVASLFSLLFFFMLGAVWRGLRLRGRETAVMLAAGAVTIVLLLPFGGTVGRSLAGAAAWAVEVPIGAALQGLLIGVAIATAIAAARVLLAAGSDE